jgi:hypothetical protein
MPPDVHVNVCSFQAEKRQRTNHKENAAMVKKKENDNKLPHIDEVTEIIAPVEQQMTESMMKLCRLTERLLKNEEIDEQQSNVMHRAAAHMFIQLAIQQLLIISGGFACDDVMAEDAAHIVRKTLPVAKQGMREKLSDRIKESPELMLAAVLLQQMEKEMSDGARERSRKSGIDLDMYLKEINCPA